MPFVPRALYEELTGVLADVRAGRLVFVRPVDVPAAPVTERTLTLVPSAPGPIDWATARLPEAIEYECQTRGKGPRAYHANVAMARKQLAQGVPDEDVIENIALARDVQ